MSGIEMIPCTFGRVTFVIYDFVDSEPSVLTGTWMGSTSTSFESGMSAIFSIVLSSVSFTYMRMVLSIPSIFPMSSSTLEYYCIFVALSGASGCYGGYLLSSGGCSDSLAAFDGNAAAEGGSTFA